MAELEASEDALVELKTGAEAVYHEKQIEVREVASGASRWAVKHPLADTVARVSDVGRTA